MTEDQAWQLHRDGDAYASEWLVTRFTPLAKSIAHKMNITRAAFGVFDADDYHATAMMGLWEAIGKFDGRGAFSSYAVPVIRGRVIDQLREVSSGSRDGSCKIEYAEMPQDEEIKCDGFDIVEVIAKREYEERELSTPREKMIPRSRRKCPTCGSYEYRFKTRRYRVEGSDERKKMSFYLCRVCNRDSRDYKKDGTKNERVIAERVCGRSDHEAKP